MADSDYQSPPLGGMPEIRVFAYSAWGLGHFRCPRSPGTRPTKLRVLAEDRSDPRHAWSFLLLLFISSSVEPAAPAIGQKSETPEAAVAALGPRSAMQNSTHV